MLEVCYRSLRRNIGLLLLFSIILFFSLYLFFILLFFTQQATAQSFHADQIFGETRVINLGEDTQTNQHAELMWSDQAWEVLRTFYYDTLLATDAFTTVFTSTVGVQVSEDSFNGSGQFQRWYDIGLNDGLIINSQGRWYDINAVQLNENAWDMFPLQVASGRGLETADFTTVFEDRKIPVLLGNDYVGIHDIGDVFSVLIDTIPFYFEVVGILEPNQRTFFIAYDYFVDDHIIFPAFMMDEPTGDDEAFFKPFTYSRRALGITETKLFVEDTPVAIEEMERIIQASASTLGISYELSHLDLLVVRHMELSHMIRSHLSLIYLLFISSLILIGIIMFTFARVKFHRLGQIYTVHYLIGHKKSTLIAAVILENIGIFALIIFIAINTIIFNSGFVLSPDQQDWLLATSRFEVLYQVLLNSDASSVMFWGGYRTSFLLVAVYGMLCGFISLTYSVIKINQLYKGDQV